MLKILNNYFPKVLSQIIDDYAETTTHEIQKLKSELMTEIQIKSTYIQYTRTSCRPPEFNKSEINRAIYLEKIYCINGLYNYKSLFNTDFYHSSGTEMTPMYKDIHTLHVQYRRWILCKDCKQIGDFLLLKNLGRTEICALCILTKKKHKGLKKNLYK